MELSPATGDFRPYGIQTACPSVCGNSARPGMRLRAPDVTFGAAKTPPLIAANHSHKRVDFEQNRSKLINVRFLIM